MACKRTNGAHCSQCMAVTERPAMMPTNWVHVTEHAAVKAELARTVGEHNVARNRISELLVALEKARTVGERMAIDLAVAKQCIASSYDARNGNAEQRANELADKCGDLTKALRDADHENAKLRRELEKMKGVR